MYNPTLSCYTQ